jgi:hypothetical protein
LTAVLADAALMTGEAVIRVDAARAVSRERELG